ncbi:hypothetical protein FM109_06625 [Vibrio casei]|nr:hypothetical protein FM109_06625 [Vibrio casei]
MNGVKGENSFLGLFIPKQVSLQSLKIETKKSSFMKHFNFIS